MLPPGKPIVPFIPERKVLVHYDPFSNKSSLAVNYDLLKRRIIRLHKPTALADFGIDLPALLTAVTCN